MIHPVSISLSPDQEPTNPEWWSTAYSTPYLSQLVVRPVRRIRENLGLTRDATMTYGSNESVLVSALNFIEDSQLAIDSFRLQIEPELQYARHADPGFVLLQVFGLMQAFVLQQDGVRIVWRSLSGPPRRWWSDYPELKSIRESRNACTGHPIGTRKKGEAPEYQYIERGRLCLRSFCMSGNSEEYSWFMGVHPDTLIVQQASGIISLLTEILSWRETMDGPFVQPRPV